MKFRFPSGYLSLRAAHDHLPRMPPAAPPTDPSTDAGIAVVDSHNAIAAALDLRRAILDQDLELYAMLSSATPTRLVEQALIEAALFPANAVMTFYCIERARRATRFDLSRKDLKKLTRDPLCLDEKAFRSWFNRQVRKRARTHKPAGEARKSPGRPSEKRSKAIEALKEVHEQGKLRPDMSTKELYALVKNKHPTLEMSLDTVRRAREQFAVKKKLSERLAPRKSAFRQIRQAKSARSLFAAAKMPFLRCEPP